MKKRVDKWVAFWYYSEAPYGKGAAERGSERAGKPHGTLKIKQRDDKEGTRKDFESESTFGRKEKKNSFKKIKSDTLVYRTLEP